MSGETEHDDGRRTVGLYLPFTAAGVTVKAITFQPCTFGVLLRWQAGKIMGSMALMAELAKVDFHILESLRRPDDQRVMLAFLDHVHPEIAEDIRTGVVPLSPAQGSSEPTQAQPVAQAVPREDLDDWGAGSGAALAPDPLQAYAGFEPVPERPIDHVPGLDP